MGHASAPEGLKSLPTDPNVSEQRIGDKHLFF